jgi:hypothetical protein
VLSVQARKGTAELADPFPCDGRKYGADESENDIGERITQYRLDVGEDPIAAGKPNGKPEQDAHNVGKPRARVRRERTLRLSTWSGDFGSGGQDLEPGRRRGGAVHMATNKQ